MRYFRTNDEVYLNARSNLDQMWGHPKIAIHEETGVEVLTQSCLPDETKCLRDTNGNVLVALPDSMTEWPEVQPIIENLLNAQLLEELTKEQFEDLLPDSIL